MYSVQYFPPILTKFEFSQQIFNKRLQYHISKNLSGVS